jgi:hypothetical protein
MALRGMALGQEEAMFDTILLYVGAAVLFIWGVGHIIPTRSVVAGFGLLSDDNQINITMEWVAEGLALACVGALVALVTGIGGADDPMAGIVIWAVVAFCLVMGGWTFIVGRRSSIVPIRLCPLVLAVAAGLLLLGSLL